MFHHLMAMIFKEIEAKVKEISSDLYEHLLKGDLLGFEEELYKAVIDLYNKLAFVFIAQAAQSEELEKKARTLAQKKGLGEIRKDEVKLQLRTGHTIKIFSWFAVRSKSKRKKKKRGPNGSGCHLLLFYWGCIKGASPAYYSVVTMLSILCPSFEIVVDVLSNQHIQGKYNRIRDIAYAVGEKCLKNRIKIGLMPGETVAGKRVIISVDG